MASSYLLDTNIVLHATRQNSALSVAVDARFGLRQSPVHPAVCEVTIAELWAFARSRKWGDSRRHLLREAIDGMLVIPISFFGIHQRWAELYSYARANGLALQQDHNDMWIAAAAAISGLRLLSADKSAFLSLRGTSWLEVIVLDARTGDVLG